MASEAVRYPTFRALRWFRLLVGFGFAINLLFILPGLFAPRWLEAQSAFGITNTVHWLQNVSLLLAIVTAVYLPVMADPFRYIYCSVLVVVGRFAAGTLFLFGVAFMDYPGGMALLGFVDVILASVQGWVLYRMLLDGDPRSAW